MRPWRWSVRWPSASNDSFDRARRPTGSGPGGTSPPRVNPSDGSYERRFSEGSHPALSVRHVQHQRHALAARRYTKVPGL